jgi:hypothetical protein
MAFAADEYPLFPLSLVLYPGSALSLRIFEPRYLAMVRDCSRENRPFGVCLLLRGNEGEAGTSALAIGTLAHIVDFYTLPDGLLGIRAEGRQRFQVETAEARKDGLLIGRVSLWADEPTRVVPAEYALLATLAAHLAESFADQGVATPTKAQLDDASWVGFRLAEWLPFSPGERQQLLELEVPEARLQRIVDALPRFRSATSPSPS